MILGLFSVALAISLGVSYYEVRHSAMQLAREQLTSLARVLLSEPDLLLLDEPFSNLDVGSAQSMITRLLAYGAQPSRSGLARTLLLTTHQAELARPLAQSTLTLNAGRLVSLVGTPR